MKEVKIFTIALLMTLISSGAFSQNSFDLSKITVGGKLGMNISRIFGSDTPSDCKMKPGFVIGAIGNYQFTDKIHFQVEMNYEQKGFKGKNSYYGDYKCRLNYLTMPILVKYFFYGDNIKFFGAAGPYLGVLLSAKNIYDDDSNSFTSDCKTIDFGFVFGAGAIIPIPLPKMSLLADIRYSLGLINVYNYPGSSTSAKNGAIGINVGIIYSLF